MSETKQIDTGKHLPITPGPWEWQSMSSQVLAPRDESSRYEVAYIDSDDRLGAVPRSHRNGNGKLIAAAPKLYAACEAWVKYFDKLTQYDEPGDSLAAVRDHYHRGRIEQTRAALAKARGEHP